MFFHYRYRNFPHSPKATALSKGLGILTCFGASCLWGFFWLAIIGFTLSEGLGLADNLAYGLAAVSLIGYVFLIRWIKKAVNRKIDRIALEDLLRQRDGQ